MIKVSLINEFPIIGDAITALLSDIDDVTIVSTAKSIKKFIDSIPEFQPNIVIVISHKPDDLNSEDIHFLANHFPKIKLLIMSMYNDEKQVLRMIKAGAKGHLGNDTNRSEILEAIYTLRNGYEFSQKQ